jgi:hypothetical protein
MRVVVAASFGLERGKRAAYILDAKFPDDEVASDGLDEKAARGELAGPRADSKWNVIKLFLTANMCLMSAAIQDTLQNELLSSPMVDPS